MAQDEAEGANAEEGVRGSHAEREAHESSAPDQLGAGEPPDGSDPTAFGEQPTTVMPPLPASAFHPPSAAQEEATSRTNRKLAWALAGAVVVGGVLLLTVFRGDNGGSAPVVQAPVSDNLNSSAPPPTPSDTLPDTPTLTSVAPSSPTTLPPISTAPPTPTSTPRPVRPVAPRPIHTATRQPARHTTTHRAEPRESSSPDDYDRYDTSTDDPNSGDSHYGDRDRGSGDNDGYPDSDGTYQNGGSYPDGGY